jgi:hypothetical protein
MLNSFPADREINQSFDFAHKARCSHGRDAWLGFGDAGLGSGRSSSRWRGHLWRESGARQQSIRRATSAATFLGARSFYGLTDVRASGAQRRYSRRICFVKNARLPNWCGCTERARLWMDGGQQEYSSLER